ncbi:A/G-specific adenine glycosylase [Kwoniella newhampshirensis]|uniref:Adenine DNA glycosylase n=1 Tax=Kwoniella newhampshirensis TaxID=1651941 RepID=A0AAW0Z2D3_9TREE
MPRVVQYRGRSPSVFSVQDFEESDYLPDPPSPAKRSSVKRKRVVTTSKLSSKNRTGNGVGDMEDVVVRRSHGEEYHDIVSIVGLQELLLSWFEDVREKRGMPWRKRYDPTLSMEEKGQRAYEVSYRLVLKVRSSIVADVLQDLGEVMLQQTQVATVIAYWQKWIATWPTVADLAKADTEEVNAAWRGLGYYRRARSLLAGAKTVMGNPKYKGRLPDDPAVLEKEIDGVGRYTAGAICSMAYGVRTPIVDGNIHRLLTRLLAVHAPQTAPATIKFLWSSAEQLVDRLPEGEGMKGIAGDWNQALMELGSQICKPISPECNACPLRSECKAFAELSTPPPEPMQSECTLCAPIPVSTPANRIPSVMVFPMRKEKKASRVEQETVSVIEWHGANGQRKWLFAKRPEKGLLAGLFEPPTAPVEADADPSERLENSMATLSKYIAIVGEERTKLKSAGREVASIPHIFSHINMTYYIYHYMTTSPTESPPAIKTSAPANTVWLDEAGVESANIGTGVKKVWAEIYGSWGIFDPTSMSMSSIKKGNMNNKRKALTDQKMKKSLEDPAVEGKIVKKIMMPVMPKRKDVKVAILDENTVL